MIEEEDEKMVLNWAEEEKALLNIEKVIACSWCMNSRQLNECCNNLHKQDQKILPGKLGSAFLALLDQVSARETGMIGNIWSDLMQDAGRLQKLIKEHKELDRKAWLLALPKLEKQKDVYF